MIHNPSTQRGVVRRSLKLAYAVPALAIGVGALVLGSSAAFASGANTGFGFNAPNVTGGSGSVFLTGGGAFNSSSGFVHSAGGFKCTTTVRSGPLSGCLGGQGVRWDSQSLTTTGFKCTASDAVKHASTADDTVVLAADFSRAGDGNHESFNANMIVSTQDIALDVPGVQNVWVQGAGCGTAVVHFSH